MGERRKHKSSWDEDETKHFSAMSEHNSMVGNDRRLSHSSGHYHAVSESRTRKLRDDSEFPAWEPIEDRPIAPNSSFKNTQDGNEFGEGKRYFQKMSPGYGGMELRSYNDAHGYDQSHYQRNSGRVRNRSLSRDRERESRRGWSRSRSRSRSSSRNRYHDRTRDHTRSRSPMNARLSSRWSERRSVPEKSSQICRDLSAGGCRRGSQCRFLHPTPNTASRRERDRMVDDMTESWRGRTDHSRIPRQFYSGASSGFESETDFLDPYHEDRRSVPYKDSLKGNYASRNSQPLCKFFAAGMCKNRENCRFSHSDGRNTDRRGEAIDRRSRDKSNWSDTLTRGVANRPLDNSGRRGEVNNSSKHDRGNLWGPTCDDANKISGEIVDMRSRDKGNWSGDVAKISDRNGNMRGEATERCMLDKDTWQVSRCNEGTKISDADDRRGEDTERSLNEFGSWLGDPVRDIATDISDSGNRQTDRRSEDKNINWGITETSLPGESMGFAEPPIAKENMSYKKEEFTSYGSEFQDHDGMTKIDGQNALQENIYPPQIQQQHCTVVKNNQMSLLGPDVLDEVKDSITTHPVPFSGNIFPGHSSVSSKTDRGTNVMLPNPPNGFCTYLNEPNTGIVDPLNVTPHTLSDQKTSQSPRFLEADLANLLAKKLSDQAALSRSFVNREHPQTYAETPSFPDNSVWAPPVNAVIPQPHLGTVTHDPYSMENGRKNAEVNNLSIIPPQGTEPKQLSPLFEVGPPGFSSIKVRSEDVAANSEVNEVIVAEESKGVAEIKDPETQNVDKKIEEGVGVNKDEKAMRLLKNSLVLFVKEILKPTWKEGQMSRDDHKVVVRKVVDKVSSSVHTDHIPKTQEKVNQYLASSKPKITKLVQAYVERSLKKKS